MTDSTYLMTSDLLLFMCDLTSDFPFKLGISHHQQSDLTSYLKFKTRQSQSKFLFLYEFLFLRLRHYRHQSSLIIKCICMLDRAAETYILFMCEPL